MEQSLSRYIEDGLSACWLVCLRIFRPSLAPCWFDGLSWIRLRLVKCAGIMAVWSYESDCSSAKIRCRRLAVLKSLSEWRVVCRVKKPGGLQHVRLVCSSGKWSTVSLLRGPLRYSECFAAECFTCPQRQRHCQICARLSARLDSSSSSS